MADDSSDKPFGAEEPVLGSSQDMLFGWLVRRASADLGLAEAIAASEARRTEQLRRLEQALLARIQELQRQPAAAVAGESETFKVELDRVATRVESLESAVQQASRGREALITELARLGEQQSRLDARDAAVETRVDTIVAEIRKMQENLTAPAFLDRFAPAIADLEERVQRLTERMARLEPADPIHAAAERDAERARWSAESDERIASRIREFGDEIREKLKTLSANHAELERTRTEETVLAGRIAEVERCVRQLSAELKAELSAQRIALDAEKSRRQAGETSHHESERKIADRLGELESAVGERLADLDARCRDLPFLGQQVLSLSREMDEVKAQRPEGALEARVDALAAQMRDQRRTSESESTELARLRSEMRTLEERVTQTVSLAQQAQTLAASGHEGAEKASRDLAADLAALKSGLGDYLQALRTTQGLLESVETSMGHQFRELQDQLARTRSGAEAGEQGLDEAKQKIDALAERLAETEAVAHRAHALMINESEQEAERRGRLRIELDELRAQSTRGQATEAILRAVEENLNLKMVEWESRLPETLRLLGFRDDELRELKRQVQSLNEALLGSRELNSPAAPPRRAAPQAGDLFKRRHETELATGPLFEERAETALSTDHSNAVLPAAGASGSREQLRQLQERISADIERARAELREKSGRWKAAR